MKKLIAIAALLLSTLANAELPLQTDLPLKYLERPAAEANKPLIILLHGYGGSEGALFYVTANLPKDYNYLWLQAPMEISPGRFKWFDQDTTQPEYDGLASDLASSEKLLAAFVTAATVKYHTQPDKVVVVGFSQGAMMSYEVGLLHPELLRGIASLSGRITTALEAQLPAGKLPGNLAVFIGHGTADQSVHFVGATHAQARLRQLGIEPEFHAYEGMDHTLSEPENADLKVWLAKILPPSK